MQILDIFKKITSIPHCSKDTKKLQEFIVNFAKNYDFVVEIDSAGNILCYKNRRKVCLQSHYDMVCVGKAPDIEVFEKDGYLRAKDSSLGADNGIGVALMLYFISKDIEAEYLFTNDEEIGLIGANELELELKAKYMLNLDSEEIGSIFIGCAGGVDIFASKRSENEKISKKGVYEIKTIPFPGGHSGVDIDKDIPNAIKVLASYLSDIDDYQLILFEGGERINSISSFATALIALDKYPPKNDFITIKSKDSKQQFAIKDGEKVVKFLSGFAHGVRECDFDLKIPKTSINLAIVKLNIKEIDISLSARSMDNEKLTKIEKETKDLLESLDFIVESKGKYPAWKPKIGGFSKKVFDIYKKHFKNVIFKAIHAGLESAILSKKFPHLEIVSIGPNIQNPHSIHERVEINSIEVFVKIVEEILDEIS
ncbi:M20/M25/M40 family metallo-hydrolase [Nitrosophilus labii]|uniref:M20/M25/M40 family metallo-hydrolase n=1 Tax=Nitrosophilus labii TaxID=2706014 RepID=UPI0016573FC8|nr:M20/M25/M40 family metallo-hydrolase [Nitrosophilus labii]